MLEVSELSFAYGRHAVLDRVSLAVDAGKPVALVGANGAGKTTLLRLLAGTMYPDAGTVKVDGRDIFTSMLHYYRTLGYLPEGAPVDPTRDVGGYLKFRAKLKGEQSRRIRHRVAEALEMTGLEAYAEKPIGALSHGLRRRVAIAETILLRPRYLLLDDPFAGLDADSCAAVVAFVKSVSPFASVIVSGHDRASLAAITNRFLRLEGGRLVREDAEGRGDGGRKKGDA